jgi:hypothetical protein
MAITSLFYAGDTDTVEWAIGSSRVGIRYVAHGPNDCKVSVVSNATRTVAIAPGRISGGGVSDYNDADALIELPNVTSGTTWFLIGARRTWQTDNETVFDYIEGSSDMVLPPRPTDAGDEDFQPLALVPVTAGITTPGNPIDLRCVGINGGILVAQHDLVRSYMDEVGTAIRIGSSEWHRVFNASGVASWIDVGSVAMTETLVGLAATASPIDGWQRQGACRLTRQGPMRRLHLVVTRAGGAPTLSSDERGLLGTRSLAVLHDSDKPPAGDQVQMYGHAVTAAGNRFEASGLINGGTAAITNTAVNISLAPSAEVTLDAVWWVS